MHLQSPRTASDLRVTEFVFRELYMYTHARSPSSSYRYLSTHRSKARCGRSIYKRKAGATYDVVACCHYVAAMTTSRKFLRRWDGAVELVAKVRPFPPASPVLQT